MEDENDIEDNESDLSSFNDSDSSKDDEDEQ
jgi:hypothetical protein